MTYNITCHSVDQLWELWRTCGDWFLTNLRISMMAFTTHVFLVLDIDAFATHFCSSSTSTTLHMLLEFFNGFLQVLRSLWFLALRNFACLFRLFIFVWIAEILRYRAEEKVGWELRKSPNVCHICQTLKNGILTHLWQRWVSQSFIFFFKTKILYFVIPTWFSD